MLLAINLCCAKLVDLIKIILAFQRYNVENTFRESSASPGCMAKQNSRQFQMFFFFLKKTNFLICTDAKLICTDVLICTEAKSGFFKSTIQVYSKGIKGSRTCSAASLWSCDMNSHPCSLKHRTIHAELPLPYSTVRNCYIVDCSHKLLV